VDFRFCSFPPSTAEDAGSSSRADLFVHFEVVPDGHDKLKALISTSSGCCG
jgi:hypothetical protein